MLAFGTIPRLGRRELLAVAVFAILILAFLPIVVHKAVWLGQGDVEVFFRAGWAIWTGYPLYHVFDHHGWTYHYPPTFALFMGLFANPLPDHPQPWWAPPFPAAVAVWYLINVACLVAGLHIWANAIERTRPIELFTAEQERVFLEACDDWQFPLFLTLMLTGLRPGELTHLLLPEDLDLVAGTLRVRNKPALGWQVKTRNERDIPLVPELAAVLRHHLQGRDFGPMFRRRRFSHGTAILATARPAMEKELARRIAAREEGNGQPLDRLEVRRITRRLWVDIGAVEEDRVRTEFIRLTRQIGLPGCTAPKMLRHLFATALQMGRVDPLIRNELMGHVAAGERSAGHGLAMTAVYTHTSPETRRCQLAEALSDRAAVIVARNCLRQIR